MTLSREERTHNYLEIILSIIMRSLFTEGVVFGTVSPLFLFTPFLALRL
jgi:hypothetical protein